MTPCRLGEFDPAADGGISSGRRGKLIYNHTEAIRSLFSDFKSGGKSEDDFVKSVPLYPMGFSVLSELYSDVHGQADTGVEHGLTRAYGNALLLTLDALLQQADASALAYPYAIAIPGVDKLVSKETMLQLTALYPKLKAMDEWPEISPLTPAARAELGGVYQSGTPEGQRVMSVFDESRDPDSGKRTIDLDFSNPFLENVYSLYHELWHVYWLHSPLSQADLSAVVAALGPPDAPVAESPAADEVLLKAISSFLRRYEFYALSQQVKLYHAVGAITDSWNRNASESALDWHDVSFGDLSHHATLKRIYVEAAFPKTYLIDRLTGGATKFARDFYVLPAAIGEFELRPRPSAEYWQRQRTAFSKHFDEIYFNDKEPSENDLLSYNIPIFYDNLTTPKPVVLSCAQIHRVMNILGPRWIFGMPFLYELPPGQDCDIKPRPIKPGTEGSHNLIGPPSNGSILSKRPVHSAKGVKGVVGFPSLEGPKVKK